MSLVLDVNTEIYPICVKDRFRMVLSKSLYPDGSAVTELNPQVIYDYMSFGLTLMQGDINDYRNLLIIIE